VVMQVDAALIYSYAASHTASNAASQLNACLLLALCEGGRVVCQSMRRSCFV
jgi:hypothetical protein